MTVMCITHYHNLTVKKKQEPKEKLYRRIKSKTTSSQPTTEKSNIEQYVGSLFIFSQNLIPIILVAVLALVLYANTLKNGFVFDDEDTIVNNILITDMNNVSKLFTKDYFTFSHENSYRPAATFTYFIDYALYGLNPWGYHLTNTLLHAVNGGLLYLFLTALFKNPDYNNPSPFNIPLVISLLFVSHPVLTEAVNAISFREDLLAFLFYISTLIIYLLIRSMPRNEKQLAIGLLYAFSCLLYFLALFSKEMAVTLPLIVYCLEWFYLDRNDKRFRSFLSNRYNIGYISVTFVYLYVRFYLFQNPIEGDVSYWTLTERLSTVPYLIPRYLILLIAPFPLSADYVITPIISLFSPIFIASFITVILIFAITAYMDIHKKGKGVGFGTAFFFITLLPVYNIIPIANPLAERYLYLPTAGYAVIVGSTLYLIFKTQTRYMLITVLFILIIYALAVAQRNTTWRDDYSLWSDTVKKVPDSSLAHLNLGRAYFDKNRLDEAVREYVTALRLEPRNPLTYNNLGFAYYRMGRIDEAIGEFMTALKIKPDYAIVHNNLGIVYLGQGRVDEAIQELATASILKPDYVKARNNLGIAYSMQGRLDEAIKEYMIALKLKPDYADTHSDLGVAYSMQGRLDEAIKEYMIALKLQPDYAGTYLNLGKVYINQGKIDEAIQAYAAALRLDPGNAEIRSHLESAYRGKEFKERGASRF